MIRRDAQLKHNVRRRCHTPYKIRFRLHRNADKSFSVQCREKGWRTYARLSSEDEALDLLEHLYFKDKDEFQRQEFSMNNFVEKIIKKI